MAGGFGALAGQHQPRSTPDFGSEMLLSQGLIQYHRHGIGQIEAAAGGQHGNAEPLFIGHTRQHLGRQSPRFSPKQQCLSRQKRIIRVDAPGLGATGHQPQGFDGRLKISDGIMHGHISPLPVVQPGPAQFLVIQIKTQGANQVKPCSGVGAKTNDVSGVGRNFWLMEYDMKHGMDHGWQVEETLMVDSEPQNTEHGTRNTEHGTRNTEHGKMKSVSLVF